MSTINTIHIARVVRQTQLMARLDKELAKQQANMKELNNLVYRVVAVEANLYTIATISF